MPSLAGKTAIVTGGNSGIGYETARVLAARGAHVVLACRNRELGARAQERLVRDHPGSAVTVAVLDLGNLASIRAFAERFSATATSLDILCNNAGIMMCPESRTVDGFETQFGVNHLGHFALTGLLLACIRATPGARVVTVSSNYHKRTVLDFANLNAERFYDRRMAYQQSKLANLLFSFELQRRLEVAVVAAVSVAAHPGYATTNLQRDLPLFRLANILFAQSPQGGALPILYAATAPGVKGGEYLGPDGLFEMRGAPVRVIPSREARDPGMAKRLWDLSEELTQVTYGI